MHLSTVHRRQPPRTRENSSMPSWVPPPVSGRTEASPPPAAPPPESRAAVQILVESALQKMCPSDLSVRIQARNFAFSDKSVRSAKMVWSREGRDPYVEGAAPEQMQQDLKKNRVQLNCSLLSSSVIYTVSSSNSPVQIRRCNYLVLGFALPYLQLSKSNR